MTTKQPLLPGERILGYRCGRAEVGPDGDGISTENKKERLGGFSAQKKTRSCAEGSGGGFGKTRHPRKIRRLKRHAPARNEAAATP